MTSEWVSLFAIWTSLKSTEDGYLAIVSPAVLIQSINVFVFSTEAINNWVKLLAWWAGLLTHLVFINKA